MKLFLSIPADSLINFQGFNGTVTELVDAPSARGRAQIKGVDFKLHPEFKGPLATLCNDVKMTIVVLS